MRFALQERLSIAIITAHCPKFSSRHKEIHYSSIARDFLTLVWIWETLLWSLDDSLYYSHLVDPNLERTCWKIEKSGGERSPPSMRSMWGTSLMNLHWQNTSRSSNSLQEVNRGQYVNVLRIITDSEDIMCYKICKYIHFRGKWKLWWKYKMSIWPILPIYFLFIKCPWELAYLKSGTVCEIIGLVERPSQQTY